MYRLFSVFHKYDFKTSEKCKLFDALVLSVLNYSSEIWGLYDAKDIEHVHTKFLRKILCVKKSTNLSGLCGKQGRTPLFIIRIINMFRYWIKLLKADNTSLIKRIYCMLKLTRTTMFCIIKTCIPNKTNATKSRFRRIMDKSATL